VIGQIYKYLRWLSVDIVLGAIFFLAYLGKLFQVNISFPTYVALASAIWLIYTADHLFDAYKTEEPSFGRHLFHKRYFKQLVFISGLVMILALINLWFLDVQIIRNGAMLSAVSVAYLMLVYFVKRLWVKEILVAIVYSIGIFLAPITKVGLDIYNSILVVQLVGIAFLNLLVFSKMDIESDQKDGFNSIALKLGLKKCNMLISTIVLIIFASNIALSSLYEASSQLLYALMTAILFMIHLRPTYFSVNERFRTLGDGIFYLPALFLLF
jgi:4-hydroxybenzoate polyprenyltransferase